MTNLLILAATVVVIIYGVSSGTLTSAWGIIIGILIAALLIK